MKFHCLSIMSLLGIFSYYHRHHHLYHYKWMWRFANRFSEEILIKFLFWLFIYLLLLLLLLLLSLLLLSLLFYNLRLCTGARKGALEAGGTSKRDYGESHNYDQVREHYLHLKIFFIHFPFVFLLVLTNILLFIGLAWRWCYKRVNIIKVNDQVLCSLRNANDDD